MNGLLPNRWQKQPQTPVEINWNHPLARGLTGLWIFNTPFPINLVNKKRSTSANAQPLKNSVLGRGYVSSALQLDSDVNNLLTTTNGSIYVGMSGDGQTLGSYQAILSAASSSTSGFYIASSDTSSFSNSFYMALGNGAVSTVGSGVNKNSNAAIVFTYGGGSYKAFRKGVLNSTTSSSRPYTGALPLTVQQGFASIPNAGTKAFNAIATWDRTLTDKEAAEASRNIYQLLKPLPRLELTPNVIAFNIDIELPFPAPTFDAELIDIAAGQILFDATLPTSAPTFSATIQTGEVIPIDLPFPAPDIFLNASLFNSFGLSLPTPSIGMSMTMTTGLVIPMALPLSLPEIQSDIVSGALVNLALDLPVLDIALGFAESIDLPIPAPVFEAEMRIGSAVNVNLPMPAPIMSIELVSERALNINLPVSNINIEMALITGNVVNFELEMPAPLFNNATLLNGTVLSIELNTRVPDFIAQFGLDSLDDYDLDVPAPVFQANLFTVQSSDAGNFYNRWKR